ncbi:sulfotransferase [Colwellia maritima]|uniref:sulfotransferase n=1 Tax=Colwellia maritima TaxID=2912588 RepID=UPI003B848570
MRSEKPLTLPYLETKQTSLQICDNNEAIFILGLPRTGSTLVERIVGAHSDVFSLWRA